MHSHILYIDESVAGTDCPCPAAFSFGRPVKQEKGIQMERYKILHEDKDLLVIYKPPGIPVQSAKPSVPDVMSMLCNEFLERGEKKPYLGLVNRLDQPVEGIFLVGKNEKAAADLSRQAGEHTKMEKWYQALVCGSLPQKEGVLVDYLVKDGRTNQSLVVPAGTKGAKQSRLQYELLKTWGDKSLLKIRLFTGRHHQIRVQFAHAGVPIVGDRKYGKSDAGGSRLCLCACKIVFIHPRTRKAMAFQVEPTFPVPPTAPV